MSKVVLNSKTNPESNGCNFYVVRKKRFCRLTAKDGEQYCAEHTLPTTNSNDNGVVDGGNIRVVCPLDNKQ